MISLFYSFLDRNYSNLRIIFLILLFEILKGKNFRLEKMKQKREKTREKRKKKKENDKFSPTNGPFHRRPSISPSLETDYRQKIGYWGCKVVWKEEEGRPRIHFNRRETSFPREKRIRRAFRRLSPTKNLRPEIPAASYPRNSSDKTCQARFPTPLCFYIRSWRRPKKGLVIKR